MSEPSPLQRLLHRWLIEYNPLYLLSAASTLVGVNLISSAIAGDDSLIGSFGAAAIAELYSFALIAGAAWLVRIDQRRPAVMLALIAAVYQCDVTLHTETCAYLGLTGGIAAMLWLLSFVAKLEVLGWALRVRPTRGAIVLASLGASGLVLMPRVLLHVSPETGAALLAAWLFGLFTFASFVPCRVSSAVPLDAWGKTVLRRSLVSIWTLWGVLLSCHANFWAVERGLPRGVIVLVALLCAARWAIGEKSFWALVTAAVALAFAALPGSVWLIALLSAIVLAARALRRPVSVTPVVEASERPPYRSAPAAAPPRPRPVRAWVRASGPELVRLSTAALFSVHLGAWTLGWSGGALPEHVLLLDLTLTLAVIVWLRRALSLLPLGAYWLHFGVQLGWIAAPDSVLEWGIVTAAAGFVLLALGLAASHRLRSLPP